MYSRRHCIDLHRELEVGIKGTWSQYSRGAYSRSGLHQQCIGCWNFDHAGINSTMTHVVVLSAQVRRIEQLWQTLTLVIYLDQLLALEFHGNFNSRNKVTKKIAILLILIFLQWKGWHCYLKLCK